MEISVNTDCKIPSVEVDCAPIQTRMVKKVVKQSMDAPRKKLEIYTHFKGSVLCLFLLRYRQNFGMLKESL